MKRGLFLLLMFAVLLGCIACGTGEKTEAHSLEATEAVAEESRVIVETIGFLSLDFGSSLTDRQNDWDVITETSTQVVLCEVLERTDVDVTETNCLAFEYNVKILDILMDVNDMLEIGDVIPVVSNEGMMPAAEAAELLAHTARAKKFGLMQKEAYSENEYIISSNWNGIPIEVGKTYLMYLDDRYLPTEAKYSETGRSYLFEYSGEEVYNSRAMEKNASSFTEILEQVNTLIAERTGRADEIGVSAYYEELQKEESRKAAEASVTEEAA